MGKFEMLIRVQIVAAERTRPQALEHRHVKTPLRDLVERPVLLRECQSEELMAAARQQISRQMPQTADEVRFMGLKMAL